MDGPRRLDFHEGLRNPLAGSEAVRLADGLGDSGRRRRPSRRRRRGGRPGGPRCSRPSTSARPRAAQPDAVGRGSAQEVAEAGGDADSRVGSTTIPPSARASSGKWQAVVARVGEAAGEGFEDRHAEPFAVARQDEGVGGGPGPAGPLARDVAEDRDRGRDPLRPRPGPGTGEGAVVVARRAGGGPRDGRGTAMPRAPARRSSPFLTWSRPKNRRTNLPASSGNSASRSARAREVVERGGGRRRWAPRRPASGARARRWPISGRDRAWRHEARRRFFPSTSAV